MFIFSKVPHSYESHRTIVLLAKPNTHILVSSAVFTITIDLHVDYWHVKNPTCCDMWQSSGYNSYIVPCINLPWRANRCCIRIGVTDPDCLTYACTIGPHPYACGLRTVRKVYLDVLNPLVQVYILQRLSPIWLKDFSLWVCSRDEGQCYCCCYIAVASTTMERNRLWTTDLHKLQARCFDTPGKLFLRDVTMHIVSGTG